MTNNKFFGNVIWTNHALQRLNQRGLTQPIAFQAFSNADKSLAGKNKGTTEYQKRFGNSLVTIIATQNEKNEWLILSCWIDPPLPGSIDIKKNEFWKLYKKAGFWGKFWLIFKRQIGL